MCRGLAGTVLVYKLASALADQGGDLDAVEDVAKYAVTRLGTIGIGLDHCNVSTRPPRGADF
jgi:dihydroxyacetone kinase